MAAMSNHASSEDVRGESTWLFQGPSGTTRRDIWQWWQRRRFRFNRDLLLVGIVTWVLVLVAGSAAVKPGEDFGEPLMMIFGPLLYGAFANIAYTAGPIFDTTFYRGNPRKKLFRAGYIFSLVLTGLPGAWAVTAWLTSVITGHKM
jgi:hypothetical protein